MLEGKVAIVTGAARGIGRGIAEALAGEGASVVLADLGSAVGGVDYELANRSQLDAAAAEIASRGRGKTLAIPCDVTRSREVEALVAAATQAFGRLDLVVNNAGVVHFAPLEEIDEAHWDFLYAVNVKGPYLVSRAAVPELAKTQGAIVNIASVAGKRGYANGSLYCSSKFAVVGLTQSLAAELGPRGIRVNSVCPGILRTHMWTHHLASEQRGGQAAYQGAIRQLMALGREQTPADIAQAVIYLATAPNVTGVSLNVAGGMEVW
jgi:meso-butanediol dehydrogenase/(S,S)-butanediol dehydrogenase/diacetyl reductase